MREIKFRAWNEQEKIMLYRELFDMNWYTTEKNTETGSNCWGAISGGQRRFLKPMQYTGLKDKNGKEIYEGDIVKTHWQHDGSTNYDYEVIGKIIWSDYYVSFRIQNIDCDLPLCSIAQECFSDKDGDNKMEILGNIYENAELIK